MRLLDLSHVIEHRMITYPGLPGPEIGEHLSFDTSAGHYAAGTEFAAAVLLRTGWDRHWRSERYGDPAHPHLTEAGAKMLVQRGAALVGIDSVNIDDTTNGRRPAHTILLAAGTPIVEHLTGLGGLPAAGALFTAVPPAVHGLATFPVRAFATLP